MGMFDDLVPAQSAQPKQEKGALDWIADTFGPNGNLRGSAIGGVMHGMADPVVGAVQTVANLPGVKGLFGDLVNNAVKSKDAEYEAARAEAGRGGVDASRLVGNVASPVNLIAAAKVPLAATTMSRIGQGAALGGASGAMEPVTNADNFWPEKLKQVGAGTIGGAVATPILGKIGDKLARKSSAGVAQATQQEIDAAVDSALQGTGQTAADLSPQMLQGLRDEVSKAFSSGHKLDAAALLRKKDFEAAGIDPLLGQITRDPMQFAQELNLRGLAGVGDPIAARLNSQALALKNGVGQYAGDAAESFKAGDQLSTSLKGIDDSMRQRVTGLYQAARNDAGKDLDVPLQGLAQDYAQILQDFGDKVPSGVRNNLNALGLDPLNPSNQKKLFTIEDADKLLKVINQNDPGMADKPMSTALTSLRNAVKNAVLSADATGGPFKPAVDAAAQRFRLHEAIPSLEAAANGTTAADDFVKRFVINGKVNDVQGMGKLLASVDKDAYNQARSQLGADLQRAAFGENMAGDKGFAQERFNKRLRELGTDKLAAFFSPEEIANLKTLGRVGSYITSQPAGSAVNNSNTGSALFNLATKMPGGGMLGNVASGINAVTRSVKNATTAKNALAAEVPVSAADLTPQQANILAYILGGGAIGAGAASSGLVRQ